MSTIQIDRLLDLIQEGSKRPDILKFVESNHTPREEAKLIVDTRGKFRPSCKVFIA